MQKWDRSVKENRIPTARYQFWRPDQRYYNGALTERKSNRKVNVNGDRRYFDIEVGQKVRKSPSIVKYRNVNQSVKARTPVKKRKIDLDMDTELNSGSGMREVLTSRSAYVRKV